MRMGSGEEQQMGKCTDDLIQEHGPPRVMYAEPMGSEEKERLTMLHQIPFLSGEKACATFESLATKSEPGVTSLSRKTKTTLGQQREAEPQEMERCCQ